jgi:hypothetical protein
MKRSSARPILVLTLGGFLSAVCAIAGQVEDRPQPEISSSLGSLTGDLVFTPVAPCRIFDTRAGTGIQGDGTGPIAAGATVSIQVADGALASCGLPFPSTKAAVLNFVAVGGAGPGDLRAWPWDSANPPAPNASILNYVRLASFNVANGVVVPICNTATSTGGSCPKDLFLRADVSATHVVIDVLGYFAAPVATALDISTATAPYSATTGNQFSVFAPCPAGRTVTGGGFDTSMFSLPGLFVLASKPSGNGWECDGINTSGGGPWTGNCYAVCARVPGR